MNVDAQEIGHQKKVSSNLNHSMEMTRLPKYFEPEISPPSYKNGEYALGL